VEARTSIADTRGMTRCACGWMRLVAGGAILGAAVVAHALGWTPMGVFRGTTIDVQRGTPEWWGLVAALGGVAAGLILAGLRRARRSES
jgi:hypothetical protein